MREFRVLVFLCCLGACVGSTLPLGPVLRAGAHGSSLYYARLDYPADHTDMGTQAVAAGDLDGNGTPDLVVGSGGGGSVYVILNEGARNLSLPLYYPTGAKRVAMPRVRVRLGGDTWMADPGERIDSDRAPRPGVNPSEGLSMAADAHLARAPARGALAWLPKQIDYWSSAVALADFTGDEALDIVVSVLGEDRVALFVGNGDGSFGAPAAVPVGGGPTSLAVADLNGDTLADLAVANRDDGNLSILLGNGDGSFQSGVTYAVGASPYGVTLGDLNDDEVPDLAVANAESDSVSVLLGNGDGTFSAGTGFPTGAGPTSVVMGDVNDDGVVDLVLACLEQDAIAVLPGSGGGTFLPPVHSAAGDAPCFVTAGDLDQDGALDIVAANRFSGDLSVFYGQGDGTFGASTRYAVGAGPAAALVSDLDQDGEAEIVAANAWAWKVSVLWGKGDGSQVAAREYGFAGVPRVATGDLDGDSVTDMVVAALGSAEARVLMGAGDGTFTETPLALPAPTATWASIRLGDLTGDGSPDLAGLAGGTQEVLVWAGNGDGTFGSPVSHTVGSHPCFPEIADFNGDLVNDLAVLNRDSDDVSVLIGNGDGTFQPQLRSPTYAYTYHMVGGDLNHDQVADLVCFCSSDSVLVLLGRGDGTFFPQVDYWPWGSPRALDLGDLNTDGNLDVAVAGLQGVDVFWGNGDGTLGGVSHYQEVGYEPNAVAIADFDRDGVADFAAGDTWENIVTIMLGEGAGVFTARGYYGVAGWPVQAESVDLNGDEAVDLIVANEDSRSVSVLLNTGGCWDLDGDGHGNPADPACAHPERDCDDADPGVNPGAAEGPFGNPSCGDGLDNDCDGSVDAADSACAGACTDLDGDGYGDPASSDCAHPERDCDDGDPLVNPGGTEVLGNGKDDDCDPATPDVQPWAAACSIGASIPGAGLAGGSGVVNAAFLFCLPAAAVMVLRRRGSRKRWADSRRCCETDTQRLS